jgi:phosphatidylinositol alpha-1,6-mannosyltransferase
VLLASASLEAGNGGIARVGRMTLRALVEAGYPVTALSFSDDVGVDVSGCPVSGVGGSKLRFVANHLAMLPRHDLAIYDHVGLAHGRGALWPAIRRPFCVWVHGNEIWEDLQRRHKKIIQAADLVLANSVYTLARFEVLHGPLPQARVCRLATESDATCSQDVELPANGSPPTVLMLGRLETDQPGKGHRELIDCWHQIVASIPTAELLIVGQGGGLDAFKARAAQSPARARIRFLGFVPDDEIERIWQRADVFAMPSRQEGFGIVYAEAMARRKAVLASIHDAGQETNMDGVTGFNISLDDPSQIVDRLTRLLLDNDLSQRMGQAGHTRWQEHFRYECFKRRFLDALACLNGPREQEMADGA